MIQQNHSIYEFGPFRLDGRKRLLYRGTEIVPLKPKAFDTLLALVEGSGQVLEKDELMRRVWGDTAVEEGNLTFNISSLRKALGDDPHRHEYIVTIPGEGYRFVAGVRAGFDELEVRERTRVTIEEEGIRTERPHLLTGQPRPRQKFIMTGLAFIPLSLLVIGAFVWLRKDKPAIAVIPTSNKRLEHQRIIRLSDLGSVSATSISPDGKFVAYAQNYERGTGSLYVRQVDTNIESRLLEPARRIFGTTAFSPDGAFIYYIVYDQRDPDGALYRISVLGGHPTRLIPGVKLMFAISPDGTQTAFFRDELELKQKSLIVAELDGSGERKVLTRRWDEMLFFACPAWSPDGSSIAFGAIDSSTKVNTDQPSVKLYAVNTNTGEVTKLSDETWREVGKLMWMPNGRGLLFVGDRPRIGNQVYFLPYPSGESQRITMDVSNYSNYGLGITADGKTITADLIEMSAQIWSIDANGSTAHAEKVTGGNWDGARALTSLPDGGIVHVALSRDIWDLWMISEKAGVRDRKALTSDDFVEWEVCAAHDGSFLVFTSNRAGNRHLFRMEPDGSNVRQLTSGNDFETAPDVSPDGNWIVYNSRSRLWKIPSSGGAARQLTEFECVAPSFSPDGNYIACILPSNSQIKNATIVIVSAEGGEPLRRFEVIQFGWYYRAARWTPDGKALVFAKTEKQIGNLWKQSIAGGPPKPLTDFKSELIFNYIFSRDGKRIIVSRGNRMTTAVMLKDFR